MQAPWWWTKTVTCRSDIYVYFNVFFKLINVYLLVSELYIYQNAWCNNKNYMVKYLQLGTDYMYSYISQYFSLFKCKQTSMLKVSFFLFRVCLCLGTTAYMTMDKWVHRKLPYVKLICTNHSWSLDIIFKFCMREFKRDDIQQPVLVWIVIVPLPFFHWHFHIFLRVHIHYIQHAPRP